MNSNNKTLLILAAGLGSRYKALKQTESILGNQHSILEYSIFDAIFAGFQNFVIIINENVQEEFISKMEKITKDKEVNLTWVLQKKKAFVSKEVSEVTREKPWGTGHAVLCAKNAIQGNFAVINADDFYGKEIYALTAENMENVNAETFLQIAFPLHKTLSKNGKVSRGVCTTNSEGSLVTIKEHLEIQETENGIQSELGILDHNTLVSMNFWVFNSFIFEDLEKQFEEFSKSNADNKNEFFLPTAIQTMIDKNLVEVKVLASPSEWRGLTFPEDKIEMQNFLNQKINENQYPENLWN